MATEQTTSPPEPWTIRRKEFAREVRDRRGDVDSARLILAFRAEAHPSQHRDAEAVQAWASKTYVPHVYGYFASLAAAMESSDAAAIIADFEARYAAAHAQALADRQAAQRDRAAIEAACEVPPHKRSPEQQSLVTRRDALGYRTEQQTKVSDISNGVIKTCCYILGGLLLLAGIVALFIKFWLGVLSILLAIGAFGWGNDWGAPVPHRTGVRR